MVGVKVAVQTVTGGIGESVTMGVTGEVVQAASQNMMLKVILRCFSIFRLRGPQSRTMFVHDCQASFCDDPRGGLIAPTGDVNVAHLVRGIVRKRIMVTIGGMCIDQKI